MYYRIGIIDILDTSVPLWIVDTLNCEVKFENEGHRAIGGVKDSLKQRFNIFVNIPAVPF